MPYIKLEARERIGCVPIVQLTGLAPGELTYALYSLCANQVPLQYTYADLASILGCLEACKLELYRRVVTPYENKKIEANGDIEV